MSHTIFSISRTELARPGLDRPLRVETTHEEVPSAVIRELLTIAESARELPRPFQQVLEIRRGPPGRLAITLERFCGIDGKQLANSLRVAGCLLPIDVWLSLADAWLAAVETISPSNTRAWATQWKHHQIGVELTGEVAITFDQFNHVLGHWPSPHADLGSRGVSGELPAFNISPESVRRQPLLEASRVHCLAASLIFLLTGEHPFAAADPQQRLKNLVDGRQSWHPARHPDCTDALAEVLRRALNSDPLRRWQSIAEFRQALKEAAAVERAPPQRVSGCVFGVTAELVRWRFVELQRERDFLPASWASGGLQVIEDRLLEQLVPPSQLPKLNAAAVPFRPGGSSRINLAPGSQPQTLWRRFWPFR